MVRRLDLASMRLTAIAVSAAATAMDSPDNITVSPRGGILLCEDGFSEDAFGRGARLLGLDASRLADIFCKNHIVLDAAQVAAAGKLVAPGGDHRGAEFAGACFEPSGRMLFVNNYTPGGHLRDRRALGSGQPLTSEVPANPRLRRTIVAPQPVLTSVLPNPTVAAAGRASGSMPPR